MTLGVICIVSCWYKIHSACLHKASTFYIFITFIINPWNGTYLLLVLADRVLQQTNQQLELDLLFPIKATERYFEKHCTRLNWYSESETITDWRLYRGSNIIKLVSAIYIPHLHHIKEDCICILNSALIYMRSNPSFCCHSAFALSNRTKEKIAEDHTLLCN
jgi:hypothetical protein